MTLTMSAAQLATIRRRTGSTTSDMTDVEVDAIYTDTTLGNTDMARTTYFVLTDLYGLTLMLVDTSNEVDNLSISSSQRRTNYEAALAFWGKVTGLGTQGVTFTADSTYTFRADSLQAEEPTYERGTLTLGWEE